MSTQVQTKVKLETSIWNNLILEFIFYINEKQAFLQEKIIEIQEFGINIGEKITNHILSFGNKSKLEEQDVIKFISNDVFSYIYKPTSKTLSNNKKTYMFEVDDLPIIVPYINDKVPSQKNEVFIDLILQVYCGIIKGCLKIFDLESIVSSNYKYDILYHNLISSKRHESNPITFTIYILQVAVQI